MLNAHADEQLLMLNLIFGAAVVQSDLYYPRNSIIRSFWGQNLVRPSTADNRGLTVYFKNTTVALKLFLLKTIKQ